MAQSTIKLGQRFKDFVKAIADNFTDLYTNKADKTALIAGRALFLTEIGKFRYSYQ